MIFTKENISLRPFKAEDVNVIILWRLDAELRKLAQFHSFPVTLIQEQEWMENILKSKSDKIIYYAIENIAEKSLIGYFQLKDINWISRVAWLGIIIGESNSRGKGYGRISLELGLKYAFDTLNLRKISLQVLTENKAAIVLYEKSGFKEEGILKNHYFFGGKYFDVRIMSLFRDQYQGS